jgi:hypothetical protein
MGTDDQESPGDDGLAAATGPEPEAVSEAATEVVTEEVTEPEPPAATPPIEQASADAALVEAVAGGLTWIPFAVYLGAWIALAAASAYLLQSATVEQPARWLPEYPALVFTGVVLVALGPLMSLVVWAVARTRRGAEHRRGLLASALVRGAVATFFGALLWIVTLYVIDVLTTGSAW